MISNVKDENNWIMYKMKCIPEPLEPLMEAIKPKSMRADEPTDSKSAIIALRPHINSSVKLENAVPVSTKSEGK